MNLAPIRSIQSPNRSLRATGSAIRSIIAHDCQGSANGAANYFATRSSQVSSHFIVGDAGDVVYYCVPPELKAWHACDANSYTIGVEMGGYAEKGFSDTEMGLDAQVIAWLLLAYGLPNKFITDPRDAGWTSHYRLGKMGGGHTDFTTDAAEETKLAERVTHAYEEFATAGPTLPLWLPHGTPAPHTATLPPPPPDGWKATAKMLKEPGDKSMGGPVSGFPPGTMGDLQFRLRLVGANPQLAVDTIDGPATEAAIKTFEESCMLPVTGAVTPQMWARLDALSAKLAA